VHVAALAILLVALLLIGLDLGKMWRAWRILTEPDFHSPMAWMAWLHVIYTVLIALKLATARRDYPRISRILFWISMPVGVALVSTVGGIFGFNASRPFWNATILPLHFLIASLVAGAALVAAQVLLFTRRFPEGEADKTLVAFRPILLGLIVVGAYSALINALIILIPESPRNAEVLRLVLFGPYWWSFWLLHGGVGVLAPLLILLVGRGKLAVATAAFLVVAGFSALPPNIIIPALAVEPLLGLVRAYTDVRLHLDYYPSQAEWLVLLFITGAGWLIFLVGSRLVDCRRQES
jgi:molybdopterin-containing oxidoreductase family membrane subunit